MSIRESGGVAGQLSSKMNDAARGQRMGEVKRALAGENRDLQALLEQNRIAVNTIFSFDGKTYRMSEIRVARQTVMLEEIQRGRKDSVTITVSAKPYSVNSEIIQHYLKEQLRSPAEAEK